MEVDVITQRVAKYHMGGCVGRVELVAPCCIQHLICPLLYFLQCVDVEDMQSTKCRTSEDLRENRDNAKQSATP